MSGSNGSADQSRDRHEPSPIANGHFEPATVNAGQVRLARFRVLRDERWGRQNPDLIRRIASVRLPSDAAHA